MFGVAIDTCDFMTFLLPIEEKIALPEVWYWKQNIEDWFDLIETKNLNML